MYHVWILDVSVKKGSVSEGDSVGASWNCCGICPVDMQKVRSGYACLQWADRQEGGEDFGDQENNQDKIKLTLGRSEQNST